jgi:ribosomal protein S18 acetylase RimI-like enzyme
VGRQLGSSTADLAIHTLHAFGRKIIDTWPGRFGFEHSPTVIHRDEARNLVGVAAAQLGWDLALRSAGAADGEFVRTVHHQAYREVVKRQFGTWDSAFQDRHFAEAWVHGTYWIVLYDRQPCGYLGVDEFADHVYVREIVIAPAFQGRGIGTALLQQLLRRAGEHNLPVRLQMLHANRGAAALYRRLGFEEVGSTSTHLLFEWRRSGAQA